MRRLLRRIPSRLKKACHIEVLFSSAARVGWVGVRVIKQSARESTKSIFLPRGKRRSGGGGGGTFQVLFRSPTALTCVNRVERTSAFG